MPKQKLPISQECLDLFDDGLLLVQNSGVVQAANASAIRAFGKHLVGKHIEFLFPNGDVAALFRGSLKAQSSDEISYLHDEAVDLLFKVRACQLDESITIILFLDMTFQRNLENVRRDFVANVSHELRSPLTSLAGFVETMLTQDIGDEDMRRRFLSIMQEEAQRMSRLLDDLLSLSRVELEEHIRPDQTIQITQVIQSVCRVLEGRAQERGMTISIKTNLGDLGSSMDKEPPCQGSYDEITEVFVNIIENAIKYGARNSDIEVVVRYEDENSVRIDITNRGEGIEARHIPRLTERFYRVDRARSRKIGGTGLGLAIVKHVLSRHRGQLYVSSVPREQTTFSVKLPTTLE